MCWEIQISDEIVKQFLHNNPQLIENVDIDSIKVKKVSTHHISVSYLTPNYQEERNFAIPISHFKEIIRDQKLDILLN